MGDFVPLPINLLLSSSTVQKPETLHRNYKIYKAAKLLNKVSYIEFNINIPNQVAITSGSNVWLHDLKPDATSSLFSSSKSNLNHASFRNDGKLVCVSEESGRIHIVDVKNRLRLRRFRGHRGAARFSTFLSDNVRLLSAGDDNTLKIWDIEGESCQQSIAAHADSVRKVIENVAMSASHIFASASYDGTIKLWDLRSGDQPTAIMQHGCPVEDFAFFNSGLILASAGGTTVKLWDLSSNASKPIKSITNHIKSVTSLALTDDCHLLLTGSIDKTVKWTNLKTYEIIKSYQVNSEVLSLSLSANRNSAFAVAMANGEWIVRMDEKFKNDLPDEKNETSFLNGFDISSDFLLRQSHFSTARYFGNKIKTDKTTYAAPPDKIVKPFQSKNVSTLDKLLRSFQYRDALDLALTLSSAHVIHLLEELIQRGALYIAIANRDESAILPLLQFIYRNICGDPIYSSVVCEALQILLDENEWLQYTIDSNVLAILRRISQKLGFEIMQQNNLQEVQGLLDMILAA